MASVQHGVCEEVPVACLMCKTEIQVDRGSTGSRGSIDPPLFRQRGQAMVFDPPLFMHKSTVRSLYI